MERKETTTESTEEKSGLGKVTGYSKKLKVLGKAVRLDQEPRVPESVSDNLYKTDQGRNLENNPTNPVSKWQQKRRIKKEYEAAQSVSNIHNSRKTADTLTGAGKKATDTGQNLIEKLRKFAVDHSGLLKFILLILLVLMLIVTTFQSCSTMMTGALSTVTATSWPADDKEISKAEAYYVKLECELRKKIDKIPETHSGSDEYNYDLAEIGHDPSVLISYLCARYGGFRFADIKSDLDKLFALQYKLTIDDVDKDKIITKTVTKGESLGTVVTTGYCNCVKCCGKWAGGNTASGVYPTANHTIAVDSSDPIVPMGTEIIMNGVLYKVEDTGPLRKYGVSFDVYYDAHSEASKHGMKKWEAFYAGGKGEEVTVKTSSTVNATNVKLTAKDLESLCKSLLSEEETEMYEVYQMTHGNRMFFGTPIDYNWHENVLYQYGYYYDAIDSKVKESDEMILSLPEGVKVMSVMDGTVKAIASGKVVIADQHGYEITLTGLKNISISKNAAVETGQTIAKVNSGTKLGISFKYKGTDLNPYFYMDTGTESIASPGIIDASGIIGTPGIASEKAAAVIAEARKHLGTPYVWGGYSPGGFDCSGFVSYCLNHSGVMSIGRQTCSTLLPMCTQVSKAQLQPGDLVFFQGTYKSGLSHVGIYIGSGQYGAGTFIHCGDPCQYADLNSPWWIEHWLIGGRILK